MFLNHPMQIPFRLHDLLVVWNMFYFFHILGIMIPADELIFFRGVAKNHQPDEQVRHSSIHQFHNKQCETLQCFHAGPLGLSKVNLRHAMPPDLLFGHHIRGYRAQWFLPVLASTRPHSGKLECIVFHFKMTQTIWTEIASKFLTNCLFHVVCNYCM